MAGGSRWVPGRPPFLTIKELRMRVRMKVQISGARDGQDWPNIGETLEVPDLEGADLCRGGLADPVAEPPREEHAVAPEPEVREPKPKRRGRPPMERDENGDIIRD